MLLVKYNFTSKLNTMFYRNLSMRKIKNWYASLNKRPKNIPPYSHIIQIGDPVLRTKSENVPDTEIKSDEIKFLLSRLKTVFYKYDCVGLSASQIGIPLRIFIMEFSLKKQKEFNEQMISNRKMQLFPFTVFINPEIKIVDFKKISFPEACESVRGLNADVSRYAEVEVDAFNENGDKFKVHADGWGARIIQHEMDHLDGKIYTDIMDRKTLCCSCWEAINEKRGKIELPYSAD